jgi:hypothetical protein
MTGRAFIKLSLSAVVALLVMASSAFAQSPADTVYNPKGEVLNVVQGGGQGPSGTAGEGSTTPAAQVEAGATSPTTTEGSLPFTGFQAGLVALAGLALVGTGVAMRRVARHDA